MYTKTILLSFAASFTLLAHEVQIDSIAVEESRISLPSQSATDPLKIKNEINQEGIELFSNPAKTSLYETLDASAGFLSERTDPYGLSGVSARSRGIDNNFMSVNFNGVPNYSIRPIGAREDIYDLENIQTIEHYQGAISPQSGSGVGSKAGLINVQTIKPQKNTASKIAISGGGDDFYKLFARVDSGEILPNLTSFLSLSQSDASKWKGYGDLGPRRNLALGVKGDYEPFAFEIYYSHNEHERHNFKPLSYAQTQNLEQNYELDYSNDPTAADYYDLYKTDSVYDDLLLSHAKKIENLNYELKLYASRYDEKSDEGISGSGGGAGLQKGFVDAKRVGVMGKLGYTLESFYGELGMWAEQSRLEKYVRRVDQFDKTTHKSWAWLNKNHEPTELLSPYFLLKQEFHNTTLEAGGRYLYYKEAANDTYLPNNPYGDYDQAIANGTIAEGGRVEAMRYREFLPTVGISHMPNETYELYAKYGKGYQRPYRYSFAARYGANAQNIRTKLLAQGKTLQNVVKSWEMETSELFDAGVRGSFSWGEITLNGFYNLHKNLLSSAYDPSTDVSYLQNIGEAAIYGLELQSSFEPTQNIWFYCNPALTFSKVTKDITYNNTLHSLSGNETPETPRWSVKAGISYTQAHHTLALKAKYVGERFADIENTQKIDPYTTADLSYSYTMHHDLFFAKELKFHAKVQNIFDEKYVSSIASADLLEDTPSFYVGSPRSFIVGLQGVF